MPEHKTHIAGVGYRPGAKGRLDQLAVDAVLTLEPDLGNRYDHHAVKVMIGEFALGFVPRELSENVSRLLIEGRIIRCARRGSGTGIVIEFADLLL